MMRPYHYLCLFILLVATASGGIVLHIHHSKKLQGPLMLENLEMVSILGLGDLVLATEARYIRHMSLTDLFSPFQDTPAGFDLFPSGSFFPPPKVPDRYPDKETSGKP